MGFPKDKTPEEHWAKVAGYEVKKPEEPKETKKPQK
jgi:hypothetical protein